MDQEKQMTVAEESSDVIQKRTEFFIDELANMRQIEDRRYASLSARLTKLEGGKKGYFEDDDPTRMLGGIFMIVFAVQVLLPIIEMAVTKWRSAQLSPS